MALPLGPRRHLQAAIETQSADQPSIRPTVPSAQEPEARARRHSRYITFQLAEIAVPRSLFRKILSLIDDLRPRPAPA